MNNTTDQNLGLRGTLRNAVRTLLRPIALVLIRSGMPWREFSELSKSVFVDVASDSFGIRGRPTNVSRVSILTGISRKEVKRQRELLEGGTETQSSKTTDATRLLSGWYQDPDFLNADGDPLALTLEAEGRQSFHELFARYGGDTPEQTLLRELTSARSIERLEDGRVSPKRRYHTPDEVSEGALRFFGTNLFDHANTLSKNLAVEDGAPKWLEGFAVESNIDSRHVEEFREFLNVRGQEFLEEIDEWLSRHQQNAEDKTSTPVRLGLGVYAIEGTLPKGTMS